MTRGNDLKYKAKWDWKMTLLLGVSCLVLQGCKIAVESQKWLIFNSKWWIYAGIAVLIIGIIDTVIEAYMGLGLFYGKSQSSGGSNANSGVICALGIVLIAKNFISNICLMVVICLIVGALRYFILSKQCEKGNRYVGKVGIAKSDINYKGQGKFDEETLSVRITHDKVKKGDVIKIEEIDGFHLIVERI